MDDAEKQLNDKLNEYCEEDVYFLKAHWRAWIEEKQFELLERKTGMNIQEVYGVLNPEKVKYIAKSKHYPERYEICLKHSKRFETIVIAVFDQPSKGKLGIVTCYKRLLAEKRHF